MPGPRVALFVTCLVDMFRPSVGFATVKLLEDAGCTVEVPEAQTCCGQPAWNSGDTATAKAVARQVIATFEGLTTSWRPRGPAAATIAKDYPLMLDGRRLGGAGEGAGGADLRDHRFSCRCAEVEGVAQAVPAVVTYHDSCSGLGASGCRRSRASSWPASRGWSCARWSERDVCCGFGGTFCVKYPDISNVMAGDKTKNIAATGAELVLAGDLGCLMNMAGKASREGRSFKARHVVEVLAGDIGTPAIGEAK